MWRSRLVFIVVWVALSGCTDSSSKAAADAAYHRLERQVDIPKLQQWANTVLAESAAGQHSTTNGLVVPGKCLRKGVTTPPDARFLGFTTGERVVAIDFQGGLEFYGIVLGRSDAVFPPDYRVYRLK